jgi:acyl phosphate:glycerol-3-phosphate acyltransferase
MEYLRFIIIGYISGSILYAYLIPKFILKIDIRENSMDGNPGTANAFMNGGVLCGILVLFLELLKGFLPVWIASQFLDMENILFAGVLASPVIGHAYPLFNLKNGGKAIAVSFGALLGLFPRIDTVIFLAFFYIFFSVVLVINPHFFRSVITFLLFSLTCLLLEKNKSIILGCSIISSIVVHKHFLKYNGEKLSILPFYEAGKERKINRNKY